MTATVLPCPFCGDNDPAVAEVAIGVYALVCNDCGCTGPIPSFENAKQTGEQAIAEWNRRAPITPKEETWQERMARGGR